MFSMLYDKHTVAKTKHAVYQNIVFVVSRSLFVTVSFG